MIITRNSQLYPVQYGLGLKVRRRGRGVFKSLRRYAFPVGKFLWRKMLKPFIKNNRQEITNRSVDIIKRLAKGERPDVKEAMKEVLRSKSLSDHLRGEGLNLKRKTTDFKRRTNKKRIKTRNNNNKKRINQNGRNNQSCLEYLRAPTNRSIDTIV